MIQRYKGIGGSDVAALCGLSTYKTTYELWLEKRRALPPQPTQEETEYQLFGKLLEAPIAKVFAKRTGRTVQREKKTWRHKQYKYLLANIDRLQYDAGKGFGVLECKNVNAYKKREWVQGGVPVGYYMQLQHYILVRDLPYGSFAALFGGNEHLYFDIERDQAVIDRIVSLAQHFWECVLSGTPPDMSYDKAGQELIDRLCAKATVDKAKEKILDTPEAQAKAQRLIRLDLTLDDRGKQAKELEAWFKWEMQDAGVLLVPGVARFTWPSHTQNRINTDDLRKKYPEIAKEVTKEIPTRRFSYKVMGEVSMEAEQPDEQPLIITSGVRQIQLD
jgi:putative phage-type endonuclease